MTLDNGLDTVSEEFADYIFEVREDVGKCGGGVSGEGDGGEDDGGAVGGGAECCYGVAAPTDDFAGVAAQEDFTHKFGGWIGGYGAVGGGEVPG